MKWQELAVKAADEVIKDKRWERKQHLLKLVQYCLIFGPICWYSKGWQFWVALAVWLGLTFVCAKLQAWEAHKEIREHVRLANAALADSYSNEDYWKIRHMIVNWRERHIDRGHYAEHELREELDEYREHAKAKIPGLYNLREPLGLLFPAVRTIINDAVRRNPNLKSCHLDEEGEFHAPEDSDDQVDGREQNAGDEDERNGGAACPS